jgi:hypothetical protein
LQDLQHIDKEKSHFPYSILCVDNLDWCYCLIASYIKTKKRSSMFLAMLQECIRFIGTFVKLHFEERQ